MAQFMIKANLVIPLYTNVAADTEGEAIIQGMKILKDAVDGGQAPSEYHLSIAEIKQVDEGTP